MIAPNADRRRAASRSRERRPPRGVLRSARGPPSSTSASFSEEKGVSLLLEALDGVDGTRRHRGVRAGPGRASSARPATGVLFTGALEHRHLRHLWPLADVSVTPSVFPEAFGMVAAEAAACGSPPLVARHSGLAAVAEGLEAEYPERHRELASFLAWRRGRSRGEASEDPRLPRPEGRELSARRPPGRCRALELGARGRSATFARWVRHSGSAPMSRSASRGRLRSGPGSHGGRRGGVRDPRPANARPRQPLRGVRGGRAWGRSWRGISSAS